MFARFRDGARRLQLSLIETRRESGKVRHEHVASLGAVRLPLSPETRLEYWEQLHPRLARLANRLDTAAQGKVLAAVHDRVPMVTLDELRALKLAVAKDEAKFWEWQQQSNVEESAGYDGLARDAGKRSAAMKQAAEDAANRVGTAKDRIAKLERGEDVAGGTARLDLRKLAREAGMTAADMRHCVTLAAMSEATLERYRDTLTAGIRPGERRLARKMLAEEQLSGAGAIKSSITEEFPKRPALPRSHR